MQLLMKNINSRLINNWQIALAACLLLLAQLVSSAEIITYYHNDHTGTPVAATDENGSVLWREDYSPYGEQLTQDPKATTNRRGFTGHVQDRDLGLVYMQARYYDPVLGRFMAIDPVGVKPEASFTFNRYAYGNNNPYRFTDPNGMWAEDAVLAVPGIVLGTISLSNNIENGNWLAAAVDVVGLGLDYTAAALPAVPGGAGLLINASRYGDEAASTATQFTKGCCCFTPGTAVLTATGKQSIETIEEGTLVYAKNPETGEVALKAVTDRILTEGKPLYTLVLKNTTGVEETIEVTDNHPFWVIGKGWVDSAKLEPGMKVEAFEGKSLEVVSLTEAGRTEDTYNLTVADFHTYYAGEQLAFVHNCDCVIKSGWSSISEPKNLEKNFEKAFGKGSLNQLDSIKEQLASGRSGGTIHSLGKRGGTDLTGWKAIDVVGTGKGRGQGRVVFRETDKGIEIKGIVKGHDYKNIIED